ncbi:YMGG-like glycine zipper-containing protein [Desulfopila aestuarii]|uniref:YMGG-like Gly-zipper n=1 Tax=Desulfopila aestuarii DSM 18488 TaxID=1121416 RepID=A0A1M7YFG6_9BACT|nr:YMGG-like glycine zipper-containing protein [Desulfopila aestuarii]SHO51353.1 YMGG-like Gly-zipper [Desulfopila aestuarii DSM 18488]
MMKTMRMVVLVLLICSLIPGCAGMSDQGRTKAEGTAIGAVAGGLLGLVIGGEKGAAIGAAAGAGLGFLVGNEVAKRKQAYANTEDFLDAEIASTQEFNKTAIAYNKQLTKEIASLEKESTSLRAKYDKGKVDKKALAAKKNDLEKQLADNAKLEKTLSEELEVQNAILAQERKDRPADDKYIARLEKEVNTLQKNLETLRDGSTQLASIDQRLSV